MLLEPNEAHEASDDAPTIASVGKRSFWGSLVTRTLPNYTGPHAVGVADIEVPVRTPKTFGSFEHVKIPGKPVGLALETVLFTLFYPAVPSPGDSEQSIWFPNAVCGELASRGYIVAAVEHRDGTGPSSSIRTPDGDFKVLPFLNWKDIHWPDLQEQPKDDTILRHSQLDLRLAEMEITLKVMEMINSGQDIENMSILSPHWDWISWVGSTDANKAKVMGHSLGGTAAIKAAADPRFSFTHCIALDPAVQRIEPWTSTIDIPLLTINSEEFAVGMDGGDFTRLLGVFETAPQENSYIFNLPGGSHPSFSDIHLILPGFINKRMGLRGTPECVLELVVKTSVAFLNGKADDVKRRAEKTEGAQIRPIGVPGRIQYYDRREGTETGGSTVDLGGMLREGPTDSTAELGRLFREGDSVELESVEVEMGEAQ
ncbi:platelet-activating factor acetylhydrolase, partial [Phenoliferia sp. Uapishka_3]